MDGLVLVTGGSGYIGGWCVAELLRRGYQVRTTVRSPDREQAVVEAVSAVADPAGRRASPSPPRTPWSPRPAAGRCGCCGPPPGPE